MTTCKSNFSPNKKKHPNDNLVDSKLKPSPSSKKSGENSDKVFQKVLLMGYNGANNTGSETRLISIIEDVKRVLGPEVCITIPT